MRSLLINGRRIADDEPAYVIAEVSGNHGGSLDTATTLIRVAAMAGASAVKFVKRENATLYSEALLAAPYANEHSFGPTYGAHRAALEFKADDLRICQATAQSLMIACFATAFDEASADLLMALGMPAIKIHSGGLTDLPLLRHVAHCGKPVILSTGGGRMEDIERAVHLLTLQHCPHAILHCTAAYPLKPEEANLRVITTLRHRFPETVIGWSTHHPGLALSLVAYALGANILEHHVTLSRASKGTDHGYSLEPKGLQTLVEDCEKIRFGLGDGVKRFYDSERAPIAKMRRVDTPDGRRITGALP